MTTDQKEQLTQKLNDLRSRATLVGPQSSLWDDIMTGESILAGKDHWPYDSQESALDAIMRM